jgi:DNA-binding XRE family transcriptional regulator
MKIKVKQMEFALARIKKGLNKKELAEKIDISPSAIGQIEKGISGISVGNAKKTCEILEVEFEEIFYLN